MFEGFLAATLPPRRPVTGWVAAVLLHGALLGGFAFSARTPVITERGWPLAIGHQPIYQPVRLVKASDLEPARLAREENAAGRVVDILPPRRKARPAAPVPASKVEAPAPQPLAQGELLRLAEASASSVDSAEPLAVPHEDPSEKADHWALDSGAAGWPSLPKPEPTFTGVVTPATTQAFKMAQAPDRLNVTQAAYYRTYDTFPSLPGTVWPSGKKRYSLDAEVCVSARGEVSRVIVRDSTTPGLDRYVISAIQSWRYRPRVISGSALPFCHPIRIVYARG